MERMPWRRFAFAVAPGVLIGRRSAAVLAPAGCEIDTSDRTPSIRVQTRDPAASYRPMTRDPERSFSPVPRSV